jgi:hypothetical protein
MSWSSFEVGATFFSVWHLLSLERYGQNPSPMAVLEPRYDLKNRHGTSGCAKAVNPSGFKSLELEGVRNAAGRSGFTFSTKK